MRVDELGNLKTEIRNTVKASQQIISHIEEEKYQVRLEIKHFKRKIEILQSENPFNFTDIEMQREENEIGLGSFFEESEGNKIVYNQVPVNTLIEDKEKLKGDFSTNGCFTIGDGKEIDTTRFFKDSNELAKFLDKMLDKYDDHPSIYYTGHFYRVFRIFKRVLRPERGRGADELNNILEYEGENCYLPKGNACFLNCNNYVFKKDFSMECFEFIKSYRTRTNAMTRCRVPEFCGRYKKDIGPYDLKSNRILPRSVKQRDVCVYIQKNHFCVIWKKNRKDALINGVEERETNFKYVKNRIN